ncbi:MAG: calcium-binding protein, partial [Allosphingosinicella sp.]
RADSDSDGFITPDEVRARAGARLERRREHRFEQRDTDHDGSLSRAEFEAPRAAGAGERRGQRFARRGGGAMMARFGARAFAAMDRDSDGRVALAEAQQAALQRFDRLDSNRDGTIGPDERQAARAAMQERREELRED